MPLPEKLKLPELLTDESSFTVKAVDDARPFHVVELLHEAECLSGVPDAEPAMMEAVDRTSLAVARE